MVTTRPLHFDWEQELLGRLSLGCYSNKLVKIGMLDFLLFEIRFDHILFFDPFSYKNRLYTHVITGPFPGRHFRARSML